MRAMNTLDIEPPFIAAMRLATLVAPGHRKTRRITTRTITKYVVFNRRSFFARVSDIEIDRATVLRPPRYGCPFFEDRFVSNLDGNVKRVLVVTHTKSRIKVASVLRKFPA